jgi:hypothetical protein
MIPGMKILRFKIIIDEYLARPLSGEIDNPTRATISEVISANLRDSIIAADTRRNSGILRFGDGN